MGISLTKIEQEAPELLTLAKKADSAVSLHRLRGQKSKVALCLDFSGSMRNDYRSGSMQRLAEKALALATQLDDDGAIDLFLFDSTAEYVGEVTLANFRGIIDKLTSGRRMGTTNYADTFRKVVAHYKLTPEASEVKSGGFGGMFKKSAAGFAPRTSPVDEPVLAIFLTDGAPDSKPQAVEELTKASYAPVFWQFLSIGSESIPFLQKLDDLDARYIDNADYKPVGNVDTISDDELFNMILDEYPAWVVEQRKRGQIR
jgi:hypothetical protein